MAFDDVDLLDDDALPDNEEEGNKKPSKLPFIIFLIVSPIIIFGTVYLSSKMIMEKAAEDHLADSLALAATMASDSTIMGPDSAAVVLDSTEIIQQDIDPNRLKSEDMYTELLADTTQINFGNEEMDLKLLERFGRYRQLINTQNAELSELKILQEEREEVAKQMQNLQEISDEQARSIQLLEDDMPDRILKMMKDYQSDRDKQVAKEVTQAVVTQAEQDAEKSRRVGKVAKIYEAMKSDKAAIILAKLDDKEIKEILLKMRQRSAAKILAEFDPRLSARISRLMGGGN